MAKMHPPRFPYPSDPMRGAERRFFNACESQLDDDWIVLHEQRWSGNRNGRNQSGEADFVMLNASQGVYVVEVKGGQEIIFNGGEWFSVPHGQTTAIKISNPFSQVADSKFVLWQYIREKVPAVRLKGELGHMVVFPGHRQSGDISPQARRELICDREDLLDLKGTMKRLARQFSQRIVWTQNDVQSIVSSLKGPDFKLLGPRRIEYDEFFDQLKVLTDLQLNAFAMLRKHKLLNVHGGAGTGKTILAFHRSIELATEGKRVLYICHSAELARFLWQEIESRELKIRGFIRISGVFEFMESLLKRMKAKPRYCESFADSCLLASEDFEETYDALVIDEAQSIESELVDGLLLLLGKDGFRYIFGDPNQSTVNTGEPILGWSRVPEGHEELDEDLLPPREVVTDRSALAVYGSSNPVVLNVNCRSSEQIVEFANKIVQKKSENIGVSFAEVELVETEISGIAEGIINVARRWQEKFNVLSSELKVLFDDKLISQLLIFGEDEFVDKFGFSVRGNFAIDWNIAQHPERFVEFEDIRANYRDFLSAPKDKRGAPIVLAETYDKRLTQKFDWSFHRGTSTIEELEAYRGPDGGTLGRRERAFYEYKTRRAGLGPEFLDLTNFSEFIGLESHAVIAILPLVSRGRTPIEHRTRFIRTAYTMATRARALLAMVGEPEAISLLKRTISSDEVSFDRFPDFSKYLKP